jgi:hypothetical protein
MAQVGYSENKQAQSEDSGHIEQLVYHAMPDTIPIGP